MARYEVSGSRAFRGHEPGEVFEADLPKDVEARAIARGSITKTTPRPPAPKPAATPLKKEASDGKDSPA